jgi:hypothetical protein
MIINVQQKINIDKKLFLLIFLITFTIFVFTSDAHRYSFDEDVTQEQTMRLITLEPNPLYEQGVSVLGYEYGVLFANHEQPLCNNSLLCTSSHIGHALTQYPFVFINHNLHIITQSTIIFSNDDFDDPHYVWWRNSLNPDLTFMELTFGPFFSALSVGFFFLICRTYNFKQNNSILLAFLYAFTTGVWAYSQTSLNAVPMTAFVLLGFLFLRKFQNSPSPTFLLFCGASFGFAFLIRPDTALFIIPITIFLILHFLKQNNKIKNVISFFTPLISCYAIYSYVQNIRFTTPSDNLIQATTAFVGERAQNYDYFLENLFGLFLSPGVGLLVFSPILLSIFFSFPDFFSKHKKDCLLFLSIIFYFIYTYSNSGDAWHGLGAWSTRYFIPIIPFLLLPLAASFEQRKNKYLKISLLSAGVLGVFTNIIYLIQDVSWFVWGLMGSERGLYALGSSSPLRIHPLTLWTFEYSQLTQSIITAITNLNLDIYLVKLFGIPIFVFMLIVILFPLCFLLYRTKNKITE